MRSAKDYIIYEPGSRCGAVVGLPEEVVAMLFAFFSRNPRGVEATLQAMIDDGSLDPPEPPASVTSDKAKAFHQRTTIGYGHKSVADHATVHLFAEGVSTLSERSFMSARLLAATSKSTRYVNFSEAGYHVPTELTGDAVELYHEHVRALMTDYTALITTAVQAVRAAYPYTDAWKRASWENATEKRGLDAVRDLLPASVNTSYSMTMSATGVREMLDKRSGSNTDEIRGLACELRGASRLAAPTLIPEHSRQIPFEMFKPAPPFQNDQLLANSTVRVVSVPDWVTVASLFGMQPADLATILMNHRGHHMPPERAAELIEYKFVVQMPFAIARDLGRHRMMTQVWSDLSSGSSFGRDPIMGDAKLADDVPQIGILSVAHQQALERARIRINALARITSPVAMQYAMPLATMVTGIWKVNLRELVHLVGLRTTPQGHPAYRKFVQALVRAVKRGDQLGGSALEVVTNFDDVLVGRPN